MGQSPCCAPCSEQQEFKLETVARQFHDSTLGELLAPLGGPIVEFHDECASSKTMGTMGSSRTPSKGMNTVSTVREDFPMHTTRMEAFMALPRMQTYGQLLASGDLRRTSWDMVVHFISHEWLGFKHPDPDGVQLRRMQGIFGQIAEGKAAGLFTPEHWKAFSNRVSPGSHGQYKAVEGSALREEAPALTEESFQKHVQLGDVWLDFGSIPQSGDGDDVITQKQQQLAAIRSIPAYLERSDYFWVLTPPARHTDKGTLCSFASWRTRGWCRLEEWGNFLSRKSNAPLIITHAAKLSTIGFTDFMLASQGKPSMAPCAGAFTCCHMGHEEVLPWGEKRKMACDKEFVLPVLADLLEAKKKMLRGKQANRFPYASLMCMVEPMIFGGSAWQPAVTSEEDTIPAFLERMGLTSISDAIPPEPSNVWHYAARIGHLPMLAKLWADAEARKLLEEDDHVPTLLATMCAMQGHVEALDFLVRREVVTLQQLNFQRGVQKIGPLDRAAKYGFPAMVRYLLQERCTVDARRADGSTPLHGAASAGHAPCCKVLLEWRADVDAVTAAGKSALHLAADPLTFYGDAEGKPAALQALLEGRAAVTLRDADGLTPLDVARAAFFDRGVQVLEAAFSASA